MFVYTVVGGYLSVVMTDFIQGMLMFFALAVVFIGTVVLSTTREGCSILEP